jgi:hypothetical protein
MPEVVDLSYLSERWSSELVARTEVDNFTGGVMSEKYLANLDSQGEGPPERIRIGRKIAYPVKPFIRWLESRSEVVECKKRKSTLLDI